MGSTGLNWLYAIHKNVFQGNHIDFSGTPHGIFAKRTPTPANPVVRAAAGRGVLAAGGGAATAGAARGGGDPSPMAGIRWGFV